MATPIGPGGVLTSVRREDPVSDPDTYTVDTRRAGDLRYAVLTELDGVAIVFALQWLPRLSRWWMEVRDVTGAVLSLGHLVQPGGEVLLDPRDSRVPPGRLYWVGPEDYRADDIGQGLRLKYDTAAARQTPPTINEMLPDGVVP